MNKENKQQAVKAAQMLIDANLSQLGRESSERIAAHLQYIDGYYHDYLGEMEQAVNGIPLEEALPLLLKEQWSLMSRTQQRQWLATVKTEMQLTLAFVRRFQDALSAQATMIAEVDSLRVEALTAKLAKDEPANQHLYEPDSDDTSPAEGTHEEQRAE